MASERAVLYHGFTVTEICPLFYAVVQNSGYSVRQRSLPHQTPSQTPLHAFNNMFFSEGTTPA
jgi:hypothetical protein